MFIFSFDFMQRAFIAGLITAILAATLGVFIVLRRLSLVGDSLSHASLAGVAGGMLLGFYPFYGALLAAAGAALLIEFIRRAFPRYAEVALAVVMSSAMALAVVMISLKKAFNADLFSYLFGSLVAVSPADVAVIAGAGIFILTSIVFLYRELFAITFDEEAARLAGIPVAAVNIYFTLLTALTVALAVRVVGTLLVSALMVIPPAVSLQIARSFKAAFGIAIGVALLAVITGLYASFIFDLAPGGTIVLIASAILVAVMVAKGAINRWK
ncbi:ABC-3 [Moorella glycerini]|uniref:High-affinity zinc uptake system membrane protein ZnuB n=1 Tax=Neomoorella stamsii TaxID=1266720 RepID=A0A9X7J0V4_9FIRM|nr:MULTISPECIES: metal ABC transporter permease [Moorella]PRR70352.1 High-affinity zinc uptake system membrane protein ZnuB [Moorella stamsii]CEP66357.1 ABC-3 [Moorella glycerini]